MKKNLLRSLLTIVLLFALATPLMAYSGFQDFLRTNGRLSYVDYTRIKQDTRRSIRVSFEIGNQSFNGVLKKGYRLDDATADSLIRSVMVEMGLNNAALVVHETNIERAKKIDPAFKPQFWIEMIGQALGAGNAMAYADLLRGKISGTEYFMGQFEGKLLSYGTAVFAEATALSPAGMVVMNLITDCGETAVKEALKAVKNDEIKQQAITSAAILDSFYKRCNQKLKAEAEKKDDTRWHLTANSKSQEIRTFFGAQVVQNWTLSCDLKIEENTESPGGIYSGYMTVDISHDMTKFDGKYLWDVVNKLPLLSQIHQKFPWQSFYDCWNLSSKLEKQLVAKKVRFVIPDNVEKIPQNSYIDSVVISDFFKSREDFWSLHPIWLVPDGVVPLLDEKGRYKLPFTDAQLGAVVYLTGEFGEDKLSPQLYALSSSMQVWMETNAPNYHHETDMSKLSEGGGVLAVNHDIFRDLESGIIILSMGWRGIDV
ncbi:MAG: hypothetical protein IJ663_02605 [Spirochaetales bacterium]|nr:hypothetical protein [Spirochaetales bacterium]